MTENTAPEQTLSPKVVQAFKQAVAQKKDENGIQLALAMVGVSMKKVRSVYNELMVSNGLATSKEEKAKIISSAIDAVQNKISEESVFNGVVATIAKGIKGMDETQIKATVRGYCKRHDPEINVYRATRGGGTGTPGFAAMYYGKLLETPTMTEDQANALIAEWPGKKDESGLTNTQRHTSHYQNIRKLANNIAAKTA